MFTGTVYFNHRIGCQKCMVSGEYFDHAMSFPRIDDVRRTDHSFRERQQPEHHREYSMLEELPVNMITDFVTSDPLHLLELGVMKRLLNIWKEGSKHFKHKWTATDLITLNELLFKCNPEIPIDIHRSVRSLEWIKFWKGTEFRTFLLYVGPVVLKSVLRTEEYEHFLYLFCAVTICSTNAYRDYLALAQTLFSEFIETYIHLYGVQSINSNVHNLCHVVEDVRKFGDLNSISTYPFENLARTIKLKLKQCDKALEQVARRLLESEVIEANRKLDMEHTKEDKDRRLSYPYIISREPNQMGYRSICIRGNIRFSSRNRCDKWIMFRNGDVAEFEYATILNDEPKICASRLEILGNFFTKPFSSNRIDIYVSNGKKSDQNLYSIKNVKCKMICLSDGDRYVLMPLLHTLSF